MPPLSKLHAPTLERLAQQLRFAPRDALLRNLERIELLATELTPMTDRASAYPEEWVAFRITGYREDITSPTSIPGDLLLADLSALAERLSTAARLTIKELHAQEPLTLDALEKRWNVSRKTINRLRREGLIARRVLDPGGKWRLAFVSSVVHAFESAHADRLSTAAAYTRMDETTRARVIRRAALYKRAGLSLNQAALRIARRLERSHEAIRQQLIAHDRLMIAQNQPPLFGWRGPVTPTDGERALESASVGIEPRVTARSSGRSAASIRRAATLVRAARVRALPSAHASVGVASPRVTSHAAAPGRAIQAPSPILALRGGALDSPHASSGLGEPGATDLLVFIQSARKREVPLGVVERARALAARELVARAQAAADLLDPSNPSPDAIDAIETALRWAARLKAELVRAQLALMVETIEARLELTLEELRAPTCLDVVRLALDAVCRAVETFEPAKGGRLAAPVGLFVSREVSRWMREHASELLARERGKAASRLTPGIPFDDWTRSVAPWQSWLEPRPEVRPARDRVSQPAREVLSRRMGWPEWRADPSTPARPQTCAEIASSLGLSGVRVARLERAAIREALASEGGVRGPERAGGSGRAGGPGDDSGARPESRAS